MKHTAYKITFQLEDAAITKHVTDGDAETYTNGAEALDQLRDMLLNCAVAADVHDGTVTLTISK
jgi:hypothetical protein